ncbi:MAG: phage major capsid protein [Rhodovibrio sp.]|nr:phage major capsid protein [Rhodovibrio sp.]
MSKRKDLKALRQRLSDAKAQGREKAAELEELEKVEEPSEEQQAKIQQLQADVEQLETQVSELGEELEAEEKKRSREQAFAPLERGQRLGHVMSREPDPERTFGFKNLAEFAQAVATASTPGSGRAVDERLTKGAAPSNYHQETGGGSGEGYMVPPEYREQIYELMLDEPLSLLSQVDSEPTNSNSVMLLRDESTPWGSTGVQAYWRAEGSQMDPSKMETEGSQVRLHELYAFVLATEELLEDTARINARLTRQAARAINWKANDAIMNGNGVGKPLGWMNSGALVSVAKESGQSADTVVANNVAKMYSRLMPTSLSRAVWMVNSDVLPQLMTMQLGDQPIWTPPTTGFANAPGGFLFGRPIVFSEHNQTLGDQGDIQLVDPMGYYLARKAAGIRFAESMHLYFDYNMRAFRWTFRFGGQPFLSQPVTPNKGSATKSHFGDDG